MIINDEMMLKVMISMLSNPKNFARSVEFDDGEYVFVIQIDSH